MLSFFANFASNDSISDDDGLYCTPDSAWNFTETCAYVSSTDACGGGGWLEWASLVYCEEDPVAKWFIVAGGCLFLVLLFLMLTSSADDFFSPNIATIVAHLNISESVAGVTFLAFGNGAPDIFGAIASVLGAPQPKADLALGSLLGGAIFVTLVVHAAVVITTPFKCAFWSTTRDLVFLIVTTTGILCFFVFFHQIQLWQPLSFLGIYVVYLTVVFITDYVKRKRSANTVRDIASAITPVITINNGDGEKKDFTNIIGASIPAFNFDENEEQEANDFIVVHHHVYRRETLTSRRNTIRSIAESKGWFAQLLSFFAIDYGDEEDEKKTPSTFDKIKAFIFWPIIALFKLTIPLAEAPWSKPLAIIHAVLVPQCILFNTQFIIFVPIEGGPGLYAYAPIISILLILFISCATTVSAEPRFYKLTYSLLGFVSSVAWIYCISTGVVGIVNMLGVVSGINQTVLGLTVIAWANSVSDLVADIAVAKQGFPRMAVAATIGGPLFNILIGFGLPFTIAKLMGDPVPIALDGINLVMIVFLFISVITTLITVVVFKGRLSRVYGIALVVIYAVFLVFIILAETGILVWI
ncbi:hypothetical protein PMAYCL1PPCAC_00861 [Pristionchus mayeri]|uniref:Sodium/calcium exchanger membrane region domain-containing protein n=1 Tax=Pristionchus mayeri TaxID=1317129 RepID=A0AAN5C6U0_9BILA|nr:hypothetical protein PMAYCL1PPCAC_00861 [Pristionchus mayeri]